MQEALTLLRFAIRVCRWCLESGRLLLFEHPAGAASWKVEQVVASLSDPRVVSIIGHQCAHDLKIDVDKYLREASRYATNGRHMASVMSKRCDGDHEHVAIEGTYNGKKISKVAQVWSQKMSRNVAQAFVDDFQSLHEYAIPLDLDNTELVKHLAKMREESCKRNGF